MSTVINIQMPAQFAPRRQQQGIVLAVALIFMVVLTLLGISAMSGSTIQTKLAAGVQERSYAFQMAESGLISAYNQLLTEYLTGSDTTKMNALLDSVAPVAVGNVEMTRTRTSGVTYKAKTANTTLQFKGFFSPKRESARDQIYSQTKMDFAHFEIRTTGQNTADSDAIQFNLSQGVRQGVPRQ